MLDMSMNSARQVCAVDQGAPSKGAALAAAPWFESRRARLLRAAERPTPGFFAVRRLRHHKWLALRRREGGLPVVQPWIPAVIFAPCPWVAPEMLEWPYYPEWTCEPLDRSPYPLGCMIGDAISYAEDKVLWVWTWGVVITVAAYEFLMLRRAWFKRNCPGHFEARA